MALTFIDRALVGFDQAIRALGDSRPASRPVPEIVVPPLSQPHSASPAVAVSSAMVVQGPTASRSAPAPQLTPTEQAHAGALMRINHVGEVCAQALYQSQALATGDPELRRQFIDAAQEEADHLAWTAQRLRELGAHPSFLNPLWFAGAFALGTIAGRMGDAASLGFVVETERQVERHLESHLEALPADDLRSRAIVAQMVQEERAHGDFAQGQGAAVLPWPVRMAMRGAAKVMTSAAYWI